jgi:hypothetical protein
MSVARASGRGSEIFDLGDGTVLRRFKNGGDPQGEAFVMDHAAQHGYPVPRVIDVKEDALVLERIDGRTMLDELRARLWRLAHHAATLALLHERLHAIPAPGALAPAGTGDALLHLDLHPENVMLSPSGPVVIDWTNARRGAAALDVAMTWVIGATSGGVLGRMFLRPFLPHFDRAALVAALPLAAERRIADPNVSERERAAVRRLVARVR